VGNFLTAWACGWLRPDGFNHYPELFLLLFGVCLIVTHGIRLVKGEFGMARGGRGRVVKIRPHMIDLGATGISLKPKWGFPLELSKSMSRNQDPCKARLGSQ
jgi:hypothetical protein